MPTMANITVKAADGTTDVVYSAIQPAAGDKSPAIWRVEAIGSIAGNRPTFTIEAKPTLDKKARVVDFSLSYPETFTNTTTGVTAVRLRDIFKGTCIIQMDAEDTTNVECCAQGANLLTSTLIQSVLRSGFAPV